MSTGPGQSDSQPADTKDRDALVVAILKDLEQILRGRRTEVHSGSIDVEDVRQLVIEQLLEKIEEDADLERSLHQPPIRYVFLQRYTRYVLCNLWRKRQRRGSHLMRVAERAAKDVCGAPPPKEAERLESLGRVEREVEPDTDPWWTLQVLRGRETLESFARTRNISMSTARRRFVLALQQLRDLIDSSDTADRRAD